MLNSRLFKIIALACLYFLTARFGLTISPEHKFATLVWPPTGISLAALLIFGLDLWPGIALGAFFANWSLGAPLIVALGMATGNTLEAVIGSTLLKRMGFNHSLSRLQDVIMLILCAAFFSTLFSATLGVTSLFLGGIISSEAYKPTWTAWWLGDVMGDLVIAPLLLVWSVPPFTFKVSPKKINEIIGFGLLIVVGSMFIFTDLFVSKEVSFPYLYFIFPLVMIVALRLEQRGVVMALFFISILVISSIATGHSRFWVGTLSVALLFQTQIFLGILAISKLALAAIVSERREELDIREQFMSMLSHDLRTPISVIRMTTQLLARDRNASELFLKSIEKLLANTDRADRMLMDLLDTNRIRAGKKLHLKIHEVELVSLVQSTIDDLVLIYGKRFILNAPDKHIYGYWEVQGIRRILENLCVNAIKYGSPQENISVAIKELEDKVYLSVHNLGQVISKAESRELFALFKRSVQGEVGDTPGWGIGLALVKAITQSHGGSVTVESTKKLGTTFIIQLPKDSRLFYHS